MEYIEIFDKISFGTIVAIVLASMFLGGLIMKGLNKYHKYKNTLEKKDEKISAHDEKIKKFDEDILEIKGKVDTVISSLDTIREDADQREARRLRREILKFGDNVRAGKTYSRDAFQDIIESNEEYERIINRRDINNGFTEQEMIFIVKKYQELYGG